MKKFILLAMLGSALAIYQPAKAQVSVNINIGAQPQWGPRGYNYVDYYYLPDIQSYYHVPSRQFIYLERNQWVQRRNLPIRYRNYNLYSGRKVVINRPRPYLKHNVHYANYSRPANHYVVKSYGRNRGAQSIKTYHGNGRGNGHGKHKGGRH